MSDAWKGEANGQTRASPPSVGQGRHPGDQFLVYIRDAGNGRLFNYGEILRHCFVTRLALCVTTTPLLPLYTKQ